MKHVIGWSAPRNQTDAGHDELHGLPRGLEFGDLPEHLGVAVDLPDAQMRPEAGRPASAGLKILSKLPGKLLTMRQGNGYMYFRWLRPRIAMRGPGTRPRTAANMTVCNTHRRETPHPWTRCPGKYFGR